jgi:hypothetical protein
MSRLITGAATPLVSLNAVKASRGTLPSTYGWKTILDSQAAPAHPSGNGRPEIYSVGLVCEVGSERVKTKVNRNNI